MPFLRLSRSLLFFSACIYQIPVGAPAATLLPIVQEHRARCELILSKSFALSASREELLRDRFLREMPRQPKAEIAAYVESQGFRVPRRFSDVQEALASGKDFLARSEHPQEYAGGSGFFKTRSFGREDRELAEWILQHDREAGKYYGLPAKVLSAVLQTGRWSDFDSWLKKEDHRFIEGVAGILGLPMESVARDLSYSLWEEIPGYNIGLIADNTIPGRYHLFVNGRRDRESPWVGYNYSVLDQGEGKSRVWTLNLPDPIPTDDSLIPVDELIAQYEAIRKLPAFDPLHVPIMEFQVDRERRIHFLQTHRTRSIAPEPGFTLDRPKQEDEFEALFVRGATPPKGRVYEVQYYYDPIPETVLPADLEGSFDIHYMSHFGEAMARGRALRVMLRLGQDHMAHTLADGHSSRSALFKPELSFAISEKELEASWVGERISEIKYQRGGVRLRLWIVSDGRKAYFKVLEMISHGSP